MIQITPKGLGAPLVATLALGLAALVGCTSTTQSADPATTAEEATQRPTDNATPEASGQSQEARGQDSSRVAALKVTPGNPHFALEILFGAPTSIEDHPVLPGGGVAESYVASSTPFQVEAQLDKYGPRTFHFYCTEEAAQFTFTTQSSDLVRSGPCSADRVVSFTLPVDAYHHGTLTINVDSTISGTPVEVLTERKNK